MNNKFFERVTVMDKNNVKVTKLWSRGVSCRLIKYITLSPVRFTDIV